MQKNLHFKLYHYQIFGHKRGAFTVAAVDQVGLIREAEGGTLLLDEIDGLTSQAQVKLLRFLQDGEYRAVGSQQVIHADIRVFAAANADFGRIVRERKFREDLFNRLNVLALTLPALRECRGDPVTQPPFSRKAGRAHRGATEKYLSRRAEPAARSFLAGQCA